MNWTGGSLQRHSKNAHKSVVNRQKEHFAKIRTALQNRSNAPAVPFRPSYFRDEDVTLGAHLPPFGLGSVRHTGHSKRLQVLRESEEPDRRSGRNQDHRNSSEPVRDISEAAERQGNRQHRAHSHAPALSAMSTHESPRHVAGKKRKGADVETEYELLEANRARLLQQQDWAGLAASRPVKVHFPSIREKDRIGKRRRMGRRFGQQIDLGETGIQRRDRRDLKPGPYMSGALRRDVEDVRIRIGTGALTSQTSIQQGDHERDSEPLQQTGASRMASSDSMLFDTEELHASPKQGKPELRSVNRERSSFEECVAEKYGDCDGNLSLSQQSPLQDVSERRNASRNTQGIMRLNLPCESDGTDRDQRPHNHTKQIPTIVQPAEEVTNSGFQLIGDGGLPLRLTFDPSSEYVPEQGLAGDAAAAGGGDIEEAPTIRQANAGCPDLGHERRQKMEDQRRSSMPYGPSSSIVDDKQWRTFVDIPGASSTGSAASLSRMPTQPHREDAHQTGTSAWSQRATGDGRTLTRESSPISASLPAIKRTYSQRTPKDALLTEKKRDHAASVSQSHGIDESERVWRTFVFDDNNELESGATSMHDSSSEQENILKRSARSRSGVIPSCIAVASSGSSELFPRLPHSASQGSWTVSENVQDATERAPTSGLTSRVRPQPTISTTPRAYAVKSARPSWSNLQDHTSGLAPERGSDFGHGEGRSVTDASMLYNASHDTFSSGTFGSGLSLQERATHSAKGPGSKRTKDLYGRGHNSSLYPIPSSGTEA